MNTETALVTRKTVEELVREWNLATHLLKTGLDALKEAEEHFRAFDGPCSHYDLCLFTRVAASLVDLAGSETLERLPGRWVFFERDFTELFGDWQRWGGMQVSNLGFTHHLTSGHQATLKLSTTCGTLDTRKRRK